MGVDCNKKSIFFIVTRSVSGRDEKLSQTSPKKGKISQKKGCFFALLAGVSDICDVKCLRLPEEILAALPAGHGEAGVLLQEVPAGSGQREKVSMQS